MGDYVTFMPLAINIWLVYAAGYSFYRHDEYQWIIYIVLVLMYDIVLTVIISNSQINSRQNFLILNTLVLILMVCSCKKLCKKKL